MKTIPYILSCFILCLISCQKETELLTKAAPADEEVLLTINLDPNSSNSPGWTTKYLITDADGQVIDMHEYANGESQIALSSKTNQVDGNLNLYEIIESAEYFFVSISLDHKKGTVIGEPYKYEAPTERKNTQLKMINFPRFDRAIYSVGESFFSTIESLSDTTYTLNKFSYKPGARFYMQTVKDNKAFYNFFDINPENGLFTVDASKCTIPSKKREIKLAKNDFLRYGYIYGLPMPGITQALDFFRSKPNENATLFYPDGIFQSYLTSIFYTQDHGTDGTRQSHANHYRGAIPTSDAPLNATAKIIKPELANFEASFTGSFKYYNLQFTRNFNLSTTNSNQNNLMVSVGILGPSHIKSFKLADLSMIDNSKYLENLKLTQISLNDYNCEKLSYFDFTSGKSLPQKYIHKVTSIDYTQSNAILNVNGIIPEQRGRLFNQQTNLMNHAGTNRLIRGFDETLQIK